MADGSITIECLAETNKFDKQMARIDKEIEKREKQGEKIEIQIVDYEQQIREFEMLENKADEYRNKLNQLKDARADNKSINEMALKYDEAVRQLDKQFPAIEKIKGKLAELRIKQQENTQEVENLENVYNRVKTNKQKDDAESFKNSMSEAGSSIGGMIGKVGKLALAIFSVRSAYMAIRQASATIAQYDETYAANLEYIRYALSMTIAPILNWIVSAVATVLQYINQIASTWFNLTGGLFKSANAFKSAKSSLGGMAKSAKEINKQLAGFDEMNILQDNTSASGGGGGGVATPSIDLSKAFDFGNIDLKAIANNIIDWLDDLFTKIRNYIYGIDWIELGSKAYQGLKDFFMGVDWAQLFDSFFETLGSIFGAIGGFIVGFLSDAWDDIVNYFDEWIKGSEELGGNWVDGILTGILYAIGAIATWIWDHVFTPIINGFKKAFGISSPSKVMMEMGGYLVEGLKNGLINIWDKLKSIFENLKTNIVNMFTKTWESIKAVFSGVGSFFGNLVNTIWNKFRDIGATVGNAIANAFKTAVNAVLSAAERIINSPIRSINSLIGVINNLPGVNLRYLNTMSFPRLATGGIVNYPNRGVGIGRALAGESGAEGVIPLTDSQAMETLGEAIGRYINLNATIPIYVGNRQIAREIKRIGAQQSYASNM